MVKPGDASMASPFTAKLNNVMPCTDIIKQGRSTLVNTVQMFKILGLLCLSTAYSLSVMYLQVHSLCLCHLFSGWIKRNLLSCLWASSLALINKLVSHSSGNGSLISVGLVNWGQIDFVLISIDYRLLTPWVSRLQPSSPRDDLKCTQTHSNSKVVTYDLPDQSSPTYTSSFLAASQQTLRWHVNILHMRLWREYEDAKTLIMQGVKVGRLASYSSRILVCVLVFCD